MIEKQYIFPVQVFRAVYDNAQELQKKIVPEFLAREKSDESPVRYSANGYTSYGVDSDILNDPLLEDLKGFAEKCLENNLIECCYQVSMNYKNEEISIQYLKSILLLMSLMKKNGIKKFFCDDHISQRFKKLNDNDRKLIMNLIKDENLEDLILKVDQNNHLNIYGAGDIAKNITSKSILKEDKNFIKLFDSDTSKIGNKLNDLVIENPVEIKNNKNRIFISAAQAYDDVYSNLISMHIDKKRIISGIFL